MDRLKESVDVGLGLIVEEVDLRRTVDRLREEVVYQEGRAKGLKEEVEANRKIIRAHDDLAELARENGVDTQGLNGEIPF